MNIEKLLPEAHPTKEVFSHYKIPLFSIAKYIDRTYNHTCKVLGGFVKATPEIDAKLHAFARKIKSEYEIRDGGLS
jgi:hypothetical protein